MRLQLNIIDGIKVPYNFINLKGQKIGRLTINNLIRLESGKLAWECTCDCGNIKTSKHTDIKVGDVHSCGCLQKELLREKGTHHMSKTAEYRAWKRIKARVTNPNSRDYAVYSKLGMEESWKNDFLIFLDHIGKIPCLDKRYSVDRIDNLKGYFTGNVRWAVDEQQARNKGMYSNNKSGVVGVRFHKNKCGDYYCAEWYNLENKQRSKYFSIKKYGEELAFFAACEYREKQIMLLNLQGAGYTENHGK